MTPGADRNKQTKHNPQVPPIANFGTKWKIASFQHPTDFCCSSLALYAVLGQSFHASVRLPVCITEVLSNPVPTVQWSNSNRGRCTNKNHALSTHWLPHGWPDVKIKNKNSTCHNFTVVGQIILVPCHVLLSAPLWLDMLPRVWLITNTLMVSSCQRGLLPINFSLFSVISRPALTVL